MSARIRLGRRALLSSLCLGLTVGLAVVSWPLLQPRLEAAASTAGEGNVLLLVPAGLLFATATICCALVWHHVLRRAGARIGHVDACTRYGTGSLVNSVAPAKLGDLVRIGLL